MSKTEFLGPASKPPVSSQEVATQTTSSGMLKIAAVVAAMLLAVGACFALSYYGVIPPLVPLLLENALIMAGILVTLALGGAITVYYSSTKKALIEQQSKALDSSSKTSSSSSNSSSAASSSSSNSSSSSSSASSSSITSSASSIFTASAIDEHATGSLDEHADNADGIEFVYTHTRRTKTLEQQRQEEAEKKRLLAEAKLEERKRKEAAKKAEKEGKPNNTTAHGKSTPIHHGNESFSANPHSMSAPESAAHMQPLPKSSKLHTPDTFKDAINQVGGVAYLQRFRIYFPAGLKALIPDNLTQINGEYFSIVEEEKQTPLDPQYYDDKGEVVGDFAPYWNIIQPKLGTLMQWTSLPNPSQPYTPETFRDAVNKIGGIRYLHGLRNHLPAQLQALIPKDYKHINGQYFAIERVKKQVPLDPNYYDKNGRTRINFSQYWGEIIKKTNSGQSLLDFFVHSLGLPEAK